MPSIDSQIQYDPLPSYRITPARNREIKYLAIHYTAGASSATGNAKNTKNVFLERKASADFCVDDTTMYQFNPDPSNYYCWAVGDSKDTSNGGASLNGVASNTNSVSIEVCSNIKKGTPTNFGNHDGWYYTEQTLNNAITVAKIIMTKYNIPIENVVRHYDISGKLCPGIIGYNDGPLVYSDKWNTTKKGNKSPISTGQKNNSNEWLKFKQRLGGANVTLSTPTNTDQQIVQCATTQATVEPTGEGMDLTDIKPNPNMAGVAGHTNSPGNIKVVKGNPYIRQIGYYHSGGSYYPVMPNAVEGMAFWFAYMEYRRSQPQYNTIPTLWAMYAPESDGNNTREYIAGLLKATGVSRDYVLPPIPNAKEFYIKLAYACFRHECSYVPTKEDMEAAFQSFLKNPKIH